MCPKDGYNNRIINRRTGILEWAVWSKLCIVYAGKCDAGILYCVYGGSELFSSGERK